MQSSVAYFYVFASNTIGGDSRVVADIVAHSDHFLAGCAIRPLPENVSGVSTPVIVKQVRCETRQAVKDLALGWLTADENQANGRVDPRARAIGFEFLDGQRPFQQFEPKLLRG